MKKQNLIIGLTLVVTISWALPLYMVIYNRLYPSYESALAVAYGLFAGVVIHLLAICSWLLIRKSAIGKGEITGLVVSFTLMVILLVLGDSGMLSKV